jgi:cadherin 5 type 2 (VE-cadherin)
MIPVTVEDTYYSLQNLTPGASYQLQLFTEYDGRESIAYTSRNFTTSKCKR